MSGAPQKCVYLLKIGCMRTNIVIDDQLMDEAMEISGMKTKKATVEAALRQFIQLKKQSEIRLWRGKLKWEGDLEKMRLNQ